MIEINLIAKKKKALPKILGMDLSKLSPVGLVVAALVWFIPDYLFVSEWEREKNAYQQQIRELNQKLTQVNNEIRENQDVREKLDAFNEQIVRLEQRTEQVQQIINTRTNPQRVLESIARSTPDELWFQSLRIDAEGAMTVRGASSNYRSIGSLISTLNDTPFFARSVSLVSSNTEEEQIGGLSRRIESFEITGNISSFDPF